MRPRYCIPVLASLLAIGCAKSPRERGHGAVNPIIDADLQRLIHMSKRLSLEEPDPGFRAQESFLTARGIQRGRIPPRAPRVIWLEEGGGGRPTVRTPHEVADDDDPEHRTKANEYLADTRAKAFETAFRQFLTRHGTAAAPAVARAFVKESAHQDVEPVHLIEFARAYGDAIAPHLLREYEAQGGRAIVYARILRHVVTSWSRECQLQLYIKAVDDRRFGGPQYALLRTEGPGMEQSEVRYLAIELAGDLLQRNWGLKTSAADMERDIAEFKAWYRGAADSAIAPRPEPEEKAREGQQPGK